MGCLVCFACAVVLFVCVVYLLGCCVCELWCDDKCCSLCPDVVVYFCLMCLCGLFAIHCVRLYVFCVFVASCVCVLLLFIMVLNVLIVSHCVVVFVSVFFERVNALCLRLIARCRMRCVCFCACGSCV